MLKRIKISPAWLSRKRNGHASTVHTSTGQVQSNALCVERLDRYNSSPPLPQRHPAESLFHGPGTRVRPPRRWSFQVTKDPSKVAVQPPANGNVELVRISTILRRSSATCVTYPEYRDRHQMTILKQGCYLGIKGTQGLRRLVKRWTMIGTEP